MKTLSALLLCLLLAAPLRAGIPTPDSAMTFHMEKDPRKWVPQFKDGRKTGFIMEFVPEGDSIKSWKEMAAQQIAFTKVSLPKYVDTWKGMLSKADPGVEIKEETGEDGSIFVTYTSAAANEAGMRRFLKGGDGVYMLAYHVRPKLKKEETFKIWSDILHTASLVPNPEKRR